METITLKLVDILQLEVELNGFVDPQTKEVKVKGILNEKLSLVVKFWLNDLATKVASIKETVEKLRGDLIKKHGEANEAGEIAIPVFLEEKDTEGNVSRKVNPSFEAVQKEYTTLLEDTKSLEYKPIKLEDLASIETEANYPIMMKLVAPPA
jgi:hypothetical protein